jgi:hypothetical protein
MDSAFQVGTSSGNPGAFGRGLYFSADWELSAGHTRTVGETAGALLLCKVLVGRIKQAYPLFVIECYCELTVIECMLSLRGYEPYYRAGVTT